MNKASMRTKFEFEQEAKIFKQRTGWTVEYHAGTRRNATLIVDKKGTKYAYTIKRGYDSAIAEMRKIGGYKPMKIHVLIEEGNMHTDIVSRDINKIIKALIEIKNKKNIRTEDGNNKQIEMQLKHTKDGIEISL